MIWKDVRFILKGPLKSSDGTAGLRFLDGRTHKEYAAFFQIRDTVTNEWRDVQIVSAEPKDYQ